MTDRTFDATADAQCNYALAMAMMRLRALLTADRWPQPEDEFDLISAALLARVIERETVAA